MSDRPTAGGESRASVTLNPDGSVVVHTAIFEPDTGTYTLLRQIVGEELGLPVDAIQVEVWDTDGVPFDTGVGGSRVTRVAGLAAYQAARSAAQELISVGADLLGWPEEQMSLRGLEIVRQDSGAHQPWSDVLQRLNRQVVGTGHVREPAPAPVSSFTAQVAEVQVDPETGEVKVLRFTTAHDSGKILNPVDHQGQIDGSVIQGISYALSEELVVDEGRVTSTTFGEYNIPCIKDIPELITVVLESDAGPGPYNAKGIEENPCGAIVPAIANAVRDAVGARVNHLPITAEKVFQALAEGEGG